MMRGVATIIFTLALLLGQAADAAAQSPAALRNTVNQGTVAIISGGVNGTYIRIASDLAAVLDKSDQLRILPIIGKGSVQNITDLLYLRGIDLGIVQSDVLGFIRKENLHPNIEQRIRYVTKLYNEEVHILARKDVGQLADLAGKKVNVDVVGSGTAMTASTLFDTLGVKVETHQFRPGACRWRKLKDGEIAAMVYVAGKPTDLFRKIEAAAICISCRCRLTADLLQTYLPSSITHDDYPGLDRGRTVDRYRRRRRGDGGVQLGAEQRAIQARGRLRRRLLRRLRRVPEAAAAPQVAGGEPGGRVAGLDAFQPAQEWLDRRPQRPEPATTSP